MSPTRCSEAKRIVLLWDEYAEPSGCDMQFRLTYAGKLLSYRDDNRKDERVLHIHDIRRQFHLQLKKLWREHPVLSATAAFAQTKGGDPLEIINLEHFNWLPLVTTSFGLICGLDVLMLREGQPSNVRYDIDNRLKTIFDALRMPDGPTELGAKSSKGQQVPGDGEDPFYVLLQKDSLITHLAVTADTLLEDIKTCPGEPPIPAENAVRLVLNVTVRPYHVHQDNLAFVG